MVKISCIYLVPYIGQFAGIAVCYDAVTFLREFFKILIYQRAEKFLFLQRRFIYDDCGAFCFQPFHNSLDGALAEVIGVGFHRETVDTYGYFPAACRICIPGTVFIESCFFQNAFCNEILAGTVGFYDGFYDVFRDIFVVSQELLGVLGQTVAAVAEGRIVVVAADSGVKAYAQDNLIGVEAMDFRIGVQFVEEADTEG